MKNVGQMLAEKEHKLLSTSLDATVFEALQLMADRNVGALVVLEGEKLAGIFSERDYARKIILFGKSSKETLVREIMTDRVLCVTPEQTAEQCMAIMTEKRIRHLPVLDHKKVIGVISIGDVVRETISEQKSIIAQLESYIHQ
jgi:CBS domain-containing protein